MTGVFWNGLEPNQYDLVQTTKYQNGLREYINCPFGHGAVGLQYPTNWYTEMTWTTIKRPLWFHTLLVLRRSTQKTKGTSSLRGLRVEEGGLRKKREEAFILSLLFWNWIGFFVYDSGRTSRKNWICLFVYIWDGCPLKIWCLLFGKEILLISIS